MYLTKPKWILPVLLALLIALTLTACGSKDEPTPAPPAAPATVAPTATAVPPTATPVPPTATPAPTNTPTTAPEPEATADAATVPLPDDAQDVTRDGQEILFTSATDIEGLVAFYRAALAADDWTEAVDYSQVDESFAFIEFDKGEELIYLTLFNFGETSEATIDLSGAPALADGEGLAASGGEGIYIADWPTPDDATEIDLSGDTLSFKTALPLVDVAEFYRPTYESLDLNTSCLDDVAEYTSVSCSFSNGDVTISFFAFEGFDATEVEIEITNYGQESSTDSGELGVIDEEGLPVPSDHTGYSVDGGEFRRVVAAYSPSDMGTLVELLQPELVSRGWTLDDSEGTDTDVTMRFSGADGELVMTLTAGDETEVVLVQRNQAAAEEAGVLPPAGQARVYLVNFTEEDLTLTIDGQTIQVPPEAGMESPEDAPKLDLPPGTYAVTTEVGSSSVTDEITVGPDESWALLLDEIGALPIQMY